MSKKYVTKPMKCFRCKGTGLECIGMYKTDCINCKGKGERMVTLSVEDWAKEERNDRRKH